MGLARIGAATYLMLDCGSTIYGFVQPLKRQP